jgi:3-oxoacyl-[acyl-carrier protein] reductase
MTMVGSARQAMEHIHMLVVGAGITRDRVTWKLDLAQWEEVMRVNLTGAFLCCKHVVPDMRSQGWGRVVLISSVVAQIGVAGTAAYAASKAGLFGLTRTLAKEVANSGITVNCLALGYFEEGMMLRLPQEAQTRVLEGIPSRRLGRGLEVGGAVSYLCSEEASYVTGQVIGLNGGLYS